MGKMTSQQYWQGIVDRKGPIDGGMWLDEYVSRIKPKGRVLDLGCGYGNDTAYLLEQGFDVVSVDFIQDMIDRVRSEVKGSKGFAFDMEHGDWNVFKDSEFDCVVAGLSLHYFNTETTHRIIGEIKRILENGGVLLAKVNSTKDTAHGAGDGVVIEQNYIADARSGVGKRYFNEDDVKTFFSPLGKLEYWEKGNLFHGTRGTLMKHTFHIVGKK